MGYRIVVQTKNYERSPTRVLVETFIRKQLRLKAHRVTAVQVDQDRVVVKIDQLGQRLLRCGLCGHRCRKRHSVQRERSWRDLSMRGIPMLLQYRPRRVDCPRCGVRVEQFPWAPPWARVTTALAGVVAALARELSWQQTARHFGLNCKTVASAVKQAVEYGLRQRRRRPLHVLGIDEVSRRKGHHYLTVVYDLERRVLLWVGEDRTEQTLAKFFTGLGRRRCSTIQVVCMDMWAPYLNAVQHHLPRAQIVFDRFHIVQHLNRALDEVRRAEMRRLSRVERTPFKRCRFLLLKNPWNLTSEQKERLSYLVRLNAAVVRAYYLKEAFQLFWDYRQPGPAKEHLQKCMRSAMHSRLEPFKSFVRMLRNHLPGILAWTTLRVSNGALEGMNNKIKLVSHRSFGFRSVANFTAAIYHCCAHLPLPGEG